MDVFDARGKLVREDQDYIGGFARIRDPLVEKEFQREVRDGLLWSDPLLQFNPTYQQSVSVDDLVNKGERHRGCATLFRRSKTQSSNGQVMQLRQHQVDAIKLANDKRSYVLTTGTGSGKSLAYIIPIVNQILKSGTGNGIKSDHRLPDERPRQ